jgi:hypothetical protein
VGGGRRHSDTKWRGEAASGDRNGQDRFGEWREVVVSSSTDERHGGRVTAKRQRRLLTEGRGGRGGGV